VITLDFQIEQFKKEMNNIVAYSEGFMQGIERGKEKMMSNFASEVKEALKEFIDASARVNPSALHHVYEWNEAGSPKARLFDLDCVIKNNGISVSGTFTQSKSIKEGSKVPFYNKAYVMENGIPVTISPTYSSVLVFDDNGQQVFTRKPITIDNPGGRDTKGSFERVFEQFFNQYFTQAFLLQSKVMQHLSVPDEYAKNLVKGKRSGRAAGIAAGYRWVAQAGVK
jgi:hypothetical protein